MAGLVPAIYDYKGRPLASLFYFSFILALHQSDIGNLLPGQYSSQRPMYAKQ